MSAPAAIVVVPAHDEQDWIGGCLDALADQRKAPPFVVLVVLDACTDATATRVADAAARHPQLDVGVLEGPGRGAGRARRAGMDAAAARLLAAGRPDGLVATTDADSRVAPDWLAAQAGLVAAGHPVVAGRILLDPAGVPAELLAARERDAATRLAVVRAIDPQAEHHQCSGASLGLTAATYEAVGGLPDRSTLEDEALEARLRAHSIPVHRSTGVRVTTSARTTGRAARGLAQALRLEAWARAPGASGGRPERVAVRVPERSRDRPGAALATVLADAAGGALVLLPAGTDPDAHAGEVAALAGGLATPGVLLVQGVPGGGALATDPLTDLVVRPALNLHAPDLAALRAPRSAWLAVRPALLDGLALPAGEGAVLALLLAAHARGGLGALAQVALAVDAPDEPPADGRTAYALLARIAGGSDAEAGTAYVRPGAVGLVTERVDLDEVRLLPSSLP